MPLILNSGKRQSQAAVGGAVRGSGRQTTAMACGRMRKEKGEEWTPAALPYPIEQGQYGPIREYAVCQWAQLRGRRRSGHGCVVSRVVMASFQ